MMTRRKTTAPEAPAAQASAAIDGAKVKAMLDVLAESGAGAATIDGVAVTYGDGRFYINQWPCTKAQAWKILMEAAC